MRYIVSSVVFLSLAGLSFAQGFPRQGQFWSPGGYGSILNPGTGHSWRSPLGGVGNPYFGRATFGSPDIATHPRHADAVIVLFPAFSGTYSGYDYSSSGPGYGDQAPAFNGNVAPSVVINQTYLPQPATSMVPNSSGDQIPDQQQFGARAYPSPSSQSYPDAVPQQSGQSAQPAGSPDQTSGYLIAFKDHTIALALGYYTEGSTLHFVSVQQILKHVSLDLIDRDLSQRLNDERGVEFRLPPVQ